jgi:hypothetical protein
MTKRIEQLMRRAEGALGQAFRQLDVAGAIARKLDAQTLKGDGDYNFVDFMIIRELIERVGRICNAAFIADARAAGPLPFPPRDPASGSLPGSTSPRRTTTKGKKRPAGAAWKKRQT